MVVMLEGNPLATFLLVPGKKVPFAGSHGHKDAVKDDEGYQRLRRLYPSGVDAVATGEPSGIAVLDLDPPTCEKWLIDNWGRIPQTRIHLTPSGGWHCIFRHVPGLRCSTDGRIGQGIDLKADGGCAVWYDRVLSEGPVADFPPIDQHLPDRQRATLKSPASGPHLQSPATVCRRRRRSSCPAHGGRPNPFAN